MAISDTVRGTISNIKNSSGYRQRYSGCRRCGDTWNWKERHATPYAEGYSMFPLCQECWEQLDPAGRMPFYMRLVDDWAALDLHIEAELRIIREGVRVAVLRGE